MDSGRVKRIDEYKRYLSPFFCVVFFPKQCFPVMYDFPKSCKLRLNIVQAMLYLLTFVLFMLYLV